jgi:hypothetical protein
MQAVPDWLGVQFFLLVLISSRRLLLRFIVFSKMYRKNPGPEISKFAAVSFFQIFSNSLLQSFIYY